MNRVPRGARSSVWLALVLLLAPACAGAHMKPPAQATRATELRYTVRLDAALTRLDVQLCFRGSLWGGLVPGHAEAGERLRSTTWHTPGARSLTTQAGFIAVPEALREGCLSYVVSLHDGGSLGALVAHRGERLLASIPAWLWRPKRRAAEVDAALRFELPEGATVSVPWPRTGDGYRLDASAFAFDSYAAFGRFTEVVVEEAGVHARAALLGELAGLDTASAERWLRAALHIAAQSDGHFPAQGLQVLLVPQAWGDEPFGNIARGGGASVLLFVPERFDVARLSRDWVLPHELSHLLLPRLAPEDAWLSEGLATYYQELLRARAGVLTAFEALSNIAQALRSAAHEGTGRTLCDESRAMHETHAYRAVYWGGAGHWLMVDVALRQQTGGQVTLDALLSALRREARMTPPYSAHELLSRLDTLSRTGLFTELEVRCGHEPFPSFEPTLRALGVDATGRVNEAAPLRAIRAALFAAHAPK